MRTLTSKRLALSCLGLVALCLLGQCSKGPREGSHAGAPDFALKTLDGGEIQLSSLRGKVVLLDFWATWCGPCRESIPHLIDLYKKYDKDRFELIGMSLDRSNPQSVRQFRASMGIPYPIVITPDEVARGYGVTSIPTTVLIDKEGRIQAKIVGFSSHVAKEINGKVDRLTSEKP